MRNQPENDVTFELQPTLNGKLLSLRPLREDDFAALFNVASDPLLWEQHPASDRYQEHVFQTFFADAIQSGGALVAIDASDDRIIGSSRYFDYLPTENSVEIGWTFLARSYWGGVYNGEMKDLMLRHAFQFVQSVLFIIGTENIRSQKAVEKIGGTRTGSRPDPVSGTNLIYAISSGSYIGIGA